MSRRSSFGRFGSAAGLKRGAQHTTRALPKDVFGKYKSADVHTIKRKIPIEVLMLPLMVAAAFLLWIAKSTATATIPMLTKSPLRP